MSRYIRNSPIAICDRCQVKMLHKELSPDRDNPGLLVCKRCNDEFDPWKKPFFPKDMDISVPRARPDVSVSTTTAYYTVNANGEVVQATVPTNTKVVPSDT